MPTNQINQKNVGRIAERIVANELEFRGFRVSDLNSDGTSANADLLAVNETGTFQIQVKGATNTEEDRGWWIQYGHCNQEIIDKKQTMFNRRTTFYKADIVALIAVRSPNEYRCLLLPTEIAEQAAQINLDRGYRTLTRKGTPKKPHKVWINLEWVGKKPHPLLLKELEVLSPYLDNWTLVPESKAAVISCNSRYSRTISSSLLR